MFSLFAALPLLVAAPQDPTPNILVVVADDFGVNLVNAYGVAPNPPCTPSLDALAAEGMLFRDAWANPSCSPTRAALLTGRYGFRTGVGQPGGALLALSETTLAEGLRDSDAGYSTAALGKWHLAGGGGGGGGAGANSMHPNQSGFEHFAGALSGALPDYSAWTKVTDGVSQPSTVYATLDTTEDALSQIASLPEPWFLYVSYHAPHTPLHDPPQDLCPPGTTCPDGSCANLGPNSPGVEQLKAMVEVLDGQLGRILDAVDPDDTYVLFVGDNGTTAMGSQPPFSGSEAKGSVYQGGVNVPLVVRGPGVAVGETAAPVGVVDFFATIGDLTGTGLMAEDSVSFASVLSDPAQRPRSTLYAETFGPNGASLPIAMHDYALRDERFKLLVQAGQPDELYDLTVDAFEDQNLLTAPSAEAQAAYERLRAEVRVLHQGLDFEATTNALSLSAGGVQQLILAAGNDGAEQGYLVLGSASGTSPGVPLEVGTLPLVLDAYSNFTLARANQPPFGSTLGSLDLQGAGLASISLPAGSSPTLIGTALNHAYVRFDPLTAVITGVSSPEFLFLLP